MASTPQRRRPTALAISLFVLGGLTLAAGSWLGLRAWSDGASPSDHPGAGALANGAAPARRLLSVVGEGTPAAAAPEASIASRVDGAMKEWRLAIINKNAEVVESLDQMFATHPSEFVPALMASAEGDPEERVRSFSTRVLGKLRPPESAELMRKLLGDPSEYVRFNAAWAAGQLADRAAVPRLRQLQWRDPSSSVRVSAAESLRKMEGG